MFDIGFSEIMVIAVVALIVLGPEKLPKTARTLGHLFGRLQRYVSDVKADINRELELDELRKLQSQVQTAARDIETSMVSATQEIAVGRARGRVRAERGGRRREGRMRRRPGAQQASPPPVAPRPAPVEPPAHDAPRQASLPGFERG